MQWYSLSTDLKILDPPSCLYDLRRITRLIHYVTDNLTVKILYGMELDKEKQGKHKIKIEVHTNKSDSKILEKKK